MEAIRKARTRPPTMGRKRVAVAALLVTLVMAAVMNARNADVSQGGRSANTVSRSLIHSDSPDRYTQVNCCLTLPHHGNKPCPSHNYT